MTPKTAAAKTQECLAFLPLYKNINLEWALDLNLKITAARTQDELSSFRCANVIADRALKKKAKAKLALWSRRPKDTVEDEKDDKTIILSTCAGESCSQRFR